MQELCQIDREYAIMVYEMPRRRRSLGRIVVTYPKRSDSLSSDVAVLMVKNMIGSLVSYQIGKACIQYTCGLLQYTRKHHDREH